MTSTNDGKDVKSNQTSGQKGKTYYIELYKSLEARLSGECAGPERTRHVCEAWRRVHSLCLHSAPSTHPHLQSWLQRHTSHSILQTEWQAPKSKEQHTWLVDAINEFIGECQEAITRRGGVLQLWESQLLNRARWFLTVLPNPWGHPVLKALLDSRGPQPHDNEVLEWLKEERGVMFVTRLRQLAASKCDDLALLLATAVMNRVRFTARLVPDADQVDEPDKPEVLTNQLTFNNILCKEAGFTMDVWELLTDIEFVLLYKGESRARCIDLAKQTPLRNGYKLVERLHKRLENSPQEKKLWKNAKEVATLIAQVVITRCMVVPHCAGVARTALYGCVYSLVQLLPAEKLPAAAAALAAPAATSRHLHTLAAAVHAQCKEERKPFVCSLYVRAITAGMNELEKLKLETEKASEARGIEQILASWFIQLGTLLSASSRLSCECILTAFSVHPSLTMYERVKRAPPLAPLIMPDVQEQDNETNKEYGSWATDSRTQTNLVKTSETLKLKQTKKQANVLSTAIFAEGEGLGLEADLCQDLAVLLSGPRVKTLYWDLDREVLLENCRTYMERTHGGTRALTTELKYLNLDPNCFQHLPEEEEEDENNIYYGIEKGYEHLVEFEEPEPEDIICDEYRSDYSESTDTGSCNSEQRMIIPKRKKKKNKQPQISLEEEVDPLSLPSDTLSVKNERPHSKERSHQKNKVRSKSKVKVDHLKNQDENNGISDEITKEILKKVKKKERKERKKKEKLGVCNINTKDDILRSSSNLSKLVETKIVRSNTSQTESGNLHTKVHNNTCITDSDYDSQGKSSINSEYNEIALHDAFTETLAAIDELKSPEKTLTDCLQRTSFPPFSYSPNTVSSIKEDVKQNIHRLIEYRRHKVITDTSTSQHSPENQSLNFTIDHDLLESKNYKIHSSVTTPKGVNFLETHASVKLPVKQHTVAKNESRNICMASNKGNFNNEMKPLNTCFQINKDIQHLPANEMLTKKRQPKIAKPKPPQEKKQAVSKLSESQKQYQEFLLRRKGEDMQDQLSTTVSTGELQFREFLNKHLQPTELPVPPPRAQDLSKQLPSQQINSNITASQKQFHSFLKELQETINAGATNQVQDLKSLQTHEKSDTKKIIQNKKVDNTANTYARLCYMHKNKQSENKFKPANNPIIQNKPLVNVTTDQLRHLKNIDFEKVSHLQASGEIVLTKVDKPKSKLRTAERPKVLVQNIENISSCTLNNPVLSNMLLSNKNITDDTEPKKNDIKVSKQCNNNTPKVATSHLSEKDQLDLLLLLRQQNKLNPPKMPVKTEFLNNPSGIIINNSVYSEKQCLDPQNKISAVEEPRSTSCPTSVIKVARNKSLNNGSDTKQNRVKGSKQKVKNESDWKSVMDDILAHKTPTMIGPNALDIVLKKDSFEKRSSECLNSPNNRTVITSCKNQTNITNKDITKHCSRNTNVTHVKPSTSKGSSFITKPSNSADFKLKQNIVQSTIGSVEIVKKEPIRIENKHFPSVIQNSNDPFISGIPNSDYDLLEELMDDDLRQEIGELSSDEETYRTSNLSTSKMKNNLHVKECNLPMNKANVVAIENPFNYCSTTSSGTVKNSDNSNYSILKKDLSLKNSLPKTINQKNLGSTQGVNLKPQIISNELITSSKLAEKLFLSGKVCKNVSGKMQETDAPNNELCVDKVSHKKNDLMTISKSKNQHSNKMSGNICSDPKLPKTMDNTKVLINNVPQAPNIQNPAQVLLNVPQRNTQAQNVMIIGSTDLIYDPFTIHMNQPMKPGNFSDLNRNTYVAVNQAPMNVALLHSTPFVGPVLSPVIIENSVTLPVIQKVVPNISMNLTSLNSNKPETSPISEGYQNINKNVKTVTILSKTSMEVHKKICQSNKDELQEFLKFKDTPSKSTTVESEMSTTSQTVVSNRTEEVEQPILLISNKRNLIPEDTESCNKMSTKQSHSEKVQSIHLDTKSDSQVREDERTDTTTELTNTLVGKIFPVDNKTGVKMDQERIKKKRLLNLNKLDKIKNIASFIGTPIGLPFVPVKSSKQDDKVQSDLRTRRKISDKNLSSGQKKSFPIAKVNRANRTSARLTALRDAQITIQESKQNCTAEFTQNFLEDKCLIAERSVPIILKNLCSPKSDNCIKIDGLSGHNIGNIEFTTPNNEINHSYKGKTVYKENIEEEVENANDSKLINNDQLIVEASDIHVKSVGVQTGGVIKKSCQKIDKNICKDNNISKLTSRESISKESAKEVPMVPRKVNNNCEKVKKGKISKNSFGSKKIEDDPVLPEWVDIEEQIKPVMIKSTIKKSDEFCKDNISLVCDNTTRDQKAVPLITPALIKSSMKKSVELCEDNTSLVGDKIATRSHRAATPLISPVTIKNKVKKSDELSEEQIKPVMIKSTIKKSNELCKDNISSVSDNATLDRQGISLIAPATIINTIKKSDELNKDNISLVGDKNLQRDQKATLPLSSVTTIETTMKKCEDNMSLVGGTNTARDYKASPLVSPVTIQTATEKSDELSKDNISLVSDTMHNQKAASLISPVTIKTTVKKSDELSEEQIKPVKSIKSTIKKSNELCNDNISSVSDNTTLDRQGISLIAPATIINTIKKSDELNKDNISLVGDKNLQRDQKATLPLSSVTTIETTMKKCEDNMSLVGGTNTARDYKASPLVSPVTIQTATEKSDELSKDNISLVSDTIHNQKAASLISPVTIKTTVKKSDELSEEQIKPVKSIKSTIKKSNELCNDNISSVSDNTTLDRQGISLIAPATIKNTINKSDELNKDNVSLVGDKNMQRDQKATLPISSVTIETTMKKCEDNISLVGGTNTARDYKAPVTIQTAIKKSDELSKDNISSASDTSDTMHNQKAASLISPVTTKTTLKKSDELRKDKNSLVDDCNMTRDQTATPLLSPALIKSTIEISDESCTDNISFIDNKKTTQGQKVSLLKSQSHALETPNDLCTAKNLTLVDKNVMLHENKMQSQSISVKDTSAGSNNKLSVKQTPTFSSNVQEILDTKKQDVNTATRREQVDKSTIKSVNITQPEILKPRQGSKDVCSNKSSLNLQNEPCKNKNFEISEAKIMYDDLPSSYNGPQKRCVRIKLPNGNTFKATISGNSNYNIDSIFDDPTVKSLLWKNINNKTKCTLNLRQVSIQNKERPLLRTEVKTIIYPTPNKAEFINLISDDEEDTSPQSFKTEFGNYNIRLMDPSIHLKHQKKLSQKSVVLLKRCDDLLDLVSKVKANEPHKCSQSKPSENPASAPQETVTSYIEIDDSSNDSISFISSVTNPTNKTIRCSEKVDELKNLLLKDLGVEFSNDEIQNVTFNRTIGITKNVGEIKNNNEIKIDTLSVINEMRKNIEVNNSSDIKKETLNIINEIHETIEVNKSINLRTETLNIINEINENIEEDKRTEVEDDTPVCQVENNSKQFILKLKKCDDLVEKLRVKKQKCFVSLIRCDDNSQRIENKDNLCTYNEGYVESLTDFQCLRGESEATLTRSGSESILNDLDNTTVDLSLISNERSAPMSPSLIDNFEIPLSLAENIDKSYDILVGLSDKICDAEWCVTKSVISKYYSLNCSDRVLLKRIQGCDENENDSLTDCDSDLDASSSESESFQVPRLVNLVVNLLAKDSYVLERLTTEDLTSKYVQNRNSSPLKRKANEMEEIRRQNKISKFENNLIDSEYLCRLKQNIHNTEINNMVIHISEKETLSHWALTNEKSDNIDSEMKESNQPSEFKDNLQNDKQYQVASLLQIVIKQINSEVVQSDIENISNKSKRLLQSSLSEDFCSSETSENSSRIGMDLEVYVRDESNLRRHTSLSEDVASEIKENCHFDVSGNSSLKCYSGKHKNTNHREDNDLVHLDTLEDDDMRTTCVMGTETNIDHLIIHSTFDNTKTNTESLSQSKIELETDIHSVKMFNDAFIVSEVKEYDHCKDFESLPLLKETEKTCDFLYNTETQGHDVLTDIVIGEVPRNELKNDDVNEPEECNIRNLDNSECTDSAQLIKLMETSPKSQSAVNDVIAMTTVTKENTAITTSLGEPNVIKNITFDSSMSESKSEIKLKMDHALIEKEKLCANYDRAKSCSLQMPTDNSHLYLLSTNEVTSDLEPSDPFKFETKTDKVYDSGGKNCSELITTDDPTDIQMIQYQEQIKFNVTKSDTACLKSKVNLEAQESRKLDLITINNIKQSDPANSAYLNFSLEGDSLGDKSFVEVEVKQSELNTVDQLNVHLESSKSLAQDRQLQDMFKYNLHSQNHNVEVPSENLESTQTQERPAVVQQKLDFKIEDKNLLTNYLKESEEILLNKSEIKSNDTFINDTPQLKINLQTLKCENNVLDAEIIDTETCFFRFPCQCKEIKKGSLNTCEDIQDYRTKERNSFDEVKSHLPITLPESKLYIDGEMIKENKNSDVVIDSKNDNYSDPVRLKTITKLPENKLEINAPAAIIEKDTNSEVVIVTCNEKKSETIIPEKKSKSKEVDVVSDASITEKIISNKSNSEIDTILTIPMPLLQPILNNGQECLPMDTQSNFAIICPAEETKHRILNIVEDEENNLHVEVDRKSLEPHTKYELKVEVHVDNMSTLSDLDPLITMEQAFINSPVNKSLSICDQNKDVLKSFLAKSECVSSDKATNVHSRLEEILNCNAKSNNLQITTKVNCSDDIVIHKNSTSMTSVMNDIKGNTKAEKETTHVNKPGSDEDITMDDIIRCCESKESVCQKKQDYCESSEYIDVNDEMTLTKEFCESKIAGKVGSSSPNDNKLQKNVTLVYKGDSNVVLKGSIYEDPVVGTCYVFPVINRTSLNDETDCSNVCDNKTINDIESLRTNIFAECNNHNVLEDVQTIENFDVVIPKLTYSRQRFKNNDIISIGDKTNRKRKHSFYYHKFHAKRYRKGKNIDYPKISVATMLDSAYSKEYKRLLDYWTTIKFSYSRPFHKEEVDVPDILNDWPIKETNINVPGNKDYGSILFSEEQFENKGTFDPLQQTLVEEISQCNEQEYNSYDINETNFNMGFGEGSDRVIQISEKGNYISKVSAATLSDVKQSQPFLTSEHYGHCGNNQMLCMSHKHQIEILKRSLSYIQLRDKVRSFFKKTTAELNYHWLMDTMKTKYKNSYNSIFLQSGFPYDLLNSDFIEPAPVEATVQVVQVGQLPVSAAAQNPVTCDPRVTQVTDASPQCSFENSPHNDSQSPIKTEYTELTTADLSMPLVQEYDRHMEAQESSKIPNSYHEDIPVETEMTSIVKTEITVELSPLKEEPIDYNDSDDLQSLVNKHINNVDYTFDSNDNSILEPQSNTDISYESLENHETDFLTQEKQQNGSAEKTDQIAHAMNAAGIITTQESIMNTRAHALVNMSSQKNCHEGSASSTAPSANNSYSRTPVNAMTLQQALAQILPPPLNQTNVHENNQTKTNSSVTSQVLHIVQGKNTNGNQITLVDNSQNSIISNSNTPVLHIVQNKGTSNSSTTNANLGQHTNSYSGLSLVDAGIQQGNNQLLHIVNTGNQKNNNTGQILKRVNLLTNLTNVQGSNEQKMVQFVCKSADGKSIHLNAPHQRSMVLRLQPIESPSIQQNQKTAECQDNTSSSPTSNTNNNSATNKESTNAQHEIKSRSVYEENYAKFIQNSSNKSAEKSTSLPKFGQAFGKQVFQDGNQKGNEINANSSNLSSINPNSENSECPPNDNSVSLDHIGQINSPPLLLRKSPSQPSHSQAAQANLVQHIKHTIAPMNIQTMHGGVIYTRQIPVNIGGGQTINLITVPSTELMDEVNQKQKADVKFVNHNDIDSPIIKIVPQNQSTSNVEASHVDDTNNHSGMPNENAQNTPAQHQPVLTQMRIKLPMLSKTPQMVSGARVVRPSFFQIQRNVIGGANQHVYQQLVLTAAPPLGPHTIRLPQAQANRQITKTATDGQSTSEPQMSSSTLEQLREFDMVLEQVKERSTVQPNSNTNNTFTKLLTPTTETNEGTSVTSTVTESTQQVLYSIGSNQSLNVAYINRKTVATTPTTSTFVRSPDSSGIIDSSSSSSHVQIPHTVTSESTINETSCQQNQLKPAKVGSKSKSRPKSSSNPPNSLKINTLPPKPTQKPLEDEQTTQRILYILAEYKEQVENSPDKDKPAPRRRSNPPTNPSGSSKRKKSCSGSRRPGARDMSPVHGEDTCRTLGSEDSSCGTSQGDCNESCIDSHSPQDSPRKVVRKLTFENETSPVAQPRPQPQRNVIVADGQTITVARGTAGKPATAVLMPANYILPVSMVKGGQQIAIVTNRGPKLLTVGGGEGGATNALLLQRLIGPAGLKPVLTRPGVRHVRLPTAALHNLQAFNLTTATTVQPPDSTASPAPAPTPPELIETRANSSPWTDRESQDVKPERESSPEGSEPWNLPSSADPHDYTYEETVRTDNMNRTVLEAIPDRYSPDMEAQRIFDKMFDVESKKSYIDSHDDSSRCAYDIDPSDCDDKVYHQVVHKKDGTSQRHHRLTHVSAAALRHKYAILEHELRLQKSLSEECEDLGVDSPSASELFPEAELLFAASPAHEAHHHSHTPQPTILNQSGIPQPDMDDQIATDELLRPSAHEERQELDVTTLGLDEGIVTVSEDGMQATIQLDQEEFARSHPNTTFHSEPTDEGEVQPFTIAGLKGRHITSTIFHAGRAPATVLVTAPQTTVISQANPDHSIPNNVKYANMEQIIHSSPVTRGNLNLSSVLVKDDGLTKFDNILTDSRELHLSNTASAIVHSTGNATQVIRRVCYEDDKRDTRFLMDEPDAIIAGDDAKMIAEDSSRDATLESIAGDVDDDNSSPERHTELFWESNSASERSESRRPMDFSSDSEKCCKSPSFDETNSTDSSGVGTHMRLDSVIKDTRGIERSASADGSSADDTHPPLRTYPAKRVYHALDGEVERSMSGKTRAGERSPNSLEGRRRASGRGVVKRGCHCCTGSPAPPRPKKSRQRKPAMDFTN